MLKSLTGAALLALTAACATSADPTVGSRFDSFTVTADVAFDRYDEVFIAPVLAGEDLVKRIDYRPRSQGDRTRPLNEEIIEEKSEDLIRIVSGSVGEVARLVTAPGAGVLTIEMTLTDLDANRPTQADMRAQPGLSFRSRYSGGAAVDIEFREDGAVLATASDADQGNLDTQLAGTPIWSEADRFFGRLGRKLADLLD